MFLSLLLFLLLPSLGGSVTLAIYLLFEALLREWGVVDGCEVLELSFPKADWFRDAPAPL